MEFRQPLATFYSYSHTNSRDRRYLNQLRDEALGRARLDHLIDEWDDRNIRGGQNWEDEIIDRARKSQVFLLIVTNRFLGSTFIRYTELTIARALLAKRAAVILPIVVEDADWQIDELKDIQALLPNGKPVSRQNRPAAWTWVSIEVRKVVGLLADGKYFKNAEPTLPAIPSLLPFTIGRDTVIDRFENALRVAPPMRPFVCILTGERQGQAELIEHFLKDGGPVRNILALAAAHYPIEIDGAAWIGSSEPVGALLDSILTSRVEPTPPSADRQGIAASLAHHLGLSVVRCELSAAQWRACGASRFQQFLDYWAGWPTLDSKRPMIVFLSIPTETGNLVNPGAAWLPLLSITRQMTLKWLGTDARDRFLGDRVRAHLDEVFGSQASLPMEDFAPLILPILRKFQII
jgi:hypothetical protein